jgi:hypothetical protein
VVTAHDDRPDRPVPRGLVVGWLSAGEAGDPGDWRVRPAIRAPAVLALRLQRGETAVRFAGRSASAASGSWRAVRVTRARDGGPWRESVLVRETGPRTGIPRDAPVARGAWIEGWVHTVAGASARVRLVGDPGFYAHVLVLGATGGRRVTRAGGVFRGGGRTENGIFGRLAGTRDAVAGGDLVVIGPHKGAGGVGLLVGEVVESSADGEVRLRRPGVPAVGTELWVGRFARPPRKFTEDREATP